MSIEQMQIGNLIITSESKTNAVLSVDTTDEYKKRKQEATLEILSKREDFKKRGSAVIKREWIEAWKNLVDCYLRDPEQTWYNGVILEAALECMERLSQSCSVENAYKAIDIQNPNSPCVYFNMELSSWQNYDATRIVGSYHIRGKEFCDYRNQFVNQEQKPKVKTYTKKD